MTGADLIAEGRRLARPCTLLKTSGDAYAAVWRSKRSFPALASVEHWITVDRSLLPEEGKGTGRLDVYVGDAAGKWVAVVFPSELPETTDGIRLYAHPASSLPPIDAIFKLGSDEVGSWLSSNGWDRDSGYNDNFKDRKPVEEYEKAFQAQCPLYADEGDVHAVLGGWHLPWPEGNWDQLLNESLVLTTFADSEPWVEVWKTPQGYRVIPRIT